MFLDPTPVLFLLTLHLHFHQLCPVIPQVIGPLSPINSTRLPCNTIAGLTITQDPDSLLDTIDRIIIELYNAEKEWVRLSYNTYVKSSGKTSPFAGKRLSVSTKKPDSRVKICMWMRLRRYWLAASNFGTICKRRGAALVKNLLYKFPAPSLYWSKENEQRTRQAYSEYMQENGHPNLCTIRVGFVVHLQHDWLGCSPGDWVAEDPGI